MIAGEEKIQARERMKTGYTYLPGLKLELHPICEICEHYPGKRKWNDTCLKARGQKWLICYFIDHPSDPKIYNYSLQLAFGTGFKIDKIAMGTRMGF